MRPTKKILELTKLRDDQISTWEPDEFLFYNVLCSNPTLLFGKYREIYNIQKELHRLQNED